MNRGGTSTLGRAAACAVLVIAWNYAATAQEPPSENFPEIFNSQAAGQAPPTPEESARAFRVPDGFKVTLFAGEPHVQQPICFAFDDRGRIWVAECYSYAEGRFTDKQQDRIIILADHDGDGRHDERKVFWQGGHVLSSIVWGFGGLFMLEDGKLQHMPDADRDDVPDGPPRVLLDGFDKDEVGHNIVNGLMWGPDGWLYGRHGIQATSHVGPPGTPPGERTRLNASIWRFHPTRHTFEILTHGTTNPWGLDYNEVGEFFFTNNVIGHLWHMIPGAHYERMYGADFNPHVYELIEQTADHYHWDRDGYSWNEARGGEGTTNDLGGGHSHCGGMIYLGDNWPDEYRGRMFLCNTHGRRINQDILERRGVSYIAKHGPDFAFAGNEWFRGVQLAYGPDGGVYLSDWSDLGECHDTDGTHRTSGRIYKITYGDPNSVAGDLDVASLSNKRLAQLQLHKNDWYARHARRVLQERTNQGIDVSEAVQTLDPLLWKPDDSRERLRALWTLSALNEVSPLQLTTLASEDEGADEHLRSWAIRLLADTEDVEFLDGVVGALADNPDQAAGLELLYAASAMPKVSRLAALSTAEQLMKFEQHVDEPILSRMIWYGLEPHVAEDYMSVVDLVRQSKSSRLCRLVVRRITSLQSEFDDPLGHLVETLTVEDPRWGFAPGNLVDVLEGMAAALRGRRKVDMPRHWEEAYGRMMKLGDARARGHAQEIAVVFGDGRGLDELLGVVHDSNRDVAQRRDALATLAEHRADGLVPVLLQYLGDHAMAPVAAHGLANYDHPETARRILRQWGGMKEDARDASMTTLCSRAEYARRLLAAVEEGAVPREAIDVIHARQIVALGDERLTKTLGRLWGSVRATPAEKREQIEQLQVVLTDSWLAAGDLENGREIFQKSCATCHKLFGEGEEIGPDLTGSDRRNLHYVLENVIDPSAVVPEAHRMSIIQTDSGRTITGVVLEDNGQSVTVQTDKEQIVIPADEVESIEATRLSLMPDGLVAELSDEDIRDLVAYLGR